MAMVSGTIPGSRNGDLPCASNRSLQVKRLTRSQNQARKWAQKPYPKPGPEIPQTSAPATGPKGGSRPSTPTDHTCTKQAHPPSRGPRTKNAKQTRQMPRPEANWSEPTSKPSSTRLSSQAKRAASGNERCKGAAPAAADAGARHAPEGVDAFCDPARASDRGDRNPKCVALPRPPPPAPAAASAPPETNGALTPRNPASGHLIKYKS